MRKQIIKYFKKDPYDDWFLHIAMKFITPIMIGILVFILVYCIWAWSMGYPAPSDAGFIQSPIIIAN